MECARGLRRMTCRPSIVQRGLPGSARRSPWTEATWSLSAGRNAAESHRPGCGMEAPLEGSCWPSASRRVGTQRPAPQHRQGAASSGTR